jgi:hypothetical protein
VEISIDMNDRFAASARHKHHRVRVCCLPARRA